MGKYRIIELPNGKFEVSKKCRLFGWNKFITAQQGSLIVPLHFDTIESAECFIRNNQSNEEKIVKEIED